MRFLVTIITLTSIAHAAAAADAGEAREHFISGEFRTSLSWDSITAMELGVLKFGAGAGVHLVNGVEVGVEQQFIVPPESGTESRSWAYVRLVPFRDWPVVPFLSARVGYYYLPDRDAVGVGAGCGAVMFIDDYLAFEASLFTQGVFSPAGTAERQTEFDLRVVLFF
jgi:hypothetical protein